jgi:hypothetical protein
LKNNPKNSRNPKPRSRPPEGTVRHVLRLTGFTLGLTTLLILFSLLVIGLPPGLTRRITAQLQDAGIPLQVESIHLSIHRGWVLKNVHLYSTSPDDLQPLLTAQKIYLLLWPDDWRQPATGGWHIKTYIKSLGVSLGTPWENVLPDNHPFRTIHKLEADLTAAPGQLTVEEARLDWGGILLFAQGRALFAPDSSTQQQTAAGDFGRRAAQLADALNQLKCEEPLELRVNFNLNQAQPEKTSLEARLSAEGITWHSRRYNQLAGELSYRNATWTLPSIRLSQSSDEQLLVNGTIHPADRTLHVSVENTLPVSDLLNLLPEKALAAVAQTGIQPYGALDFSASVGPTSFDQLAEKADVKIRQAHLKWQDITLDPLALHLAGNGHQIDVDQIRAKINGEPLSGTLQLNRKTLAWTARIQTQCDPSLAGAYDNDLRDFLTRFDFPEHYPKADLTLSQTRPGESVVMDGTLSGEHFTCGGVPIDHLKTHLSFSNQILDLTPIHAERADKQFDGSVQVDFTRQLGIFNATNSFPPADIEHALAPGETTILDAFRFDGPVYAAGKGQIDYGQWSNHQFNGTFRAENIHMEKLQAGRFESSVAITGTRLSFTHATATLYNGQANGDATFDISLNDGSAPYRIDARFSQLDLKTLLQQVTTGDYNQINGQLSTSFTLSADATTGFWNSAQGIGQVKIENGRLADVPLFGGFSRLVQTAFAGFNLFTLTEFSADYQLHDRTLWSDNAQLGGTLLSARGRGSYAPDKGLNFTVTAEPLRQTGDQSKEWYQVQRLAATAAAPFLRLLEFHLSGPLEKPDWRFVNLPGRSKQ